MQDTPTSKIRSAAQGFVELSGTIKPVPNQQTVGQLSGDPVAWSRYQVDQLFTTQTNDGPQSYWSTIAQGASDAAFILKDDTGEALIFPAKAEMIPSETILWFGNSPVAPPPPKGFWQWFFANSSGQFRYTEQRLNLDFATHARGIFSTLGQHPEFLTLYPDLPKNFPILSSINLPIGYHYVISAIPAKRLSRNYKLKAAVFFIGFLVFSVIILNSTYPVVKKMLFNDNAHLERISY